MSPAARHGRNTRAYRRRSAKVRREAGTCWICEHPIDPNLDWRDPMSATADHVIPLNAGGRILGELRPAHRSCNSRRGDGTNTPKPVIDLPTSTAW
jgi:5-methylcytosine-specific restriction endonuclease McrA